MGIYERGIKTMIGDMTLRASLNGLISIQFKESYKNDSLNIFDITEQQLDEFFKLERESFQIKLDLNGTQFQKKCWNYLMTISYGQVRSYKEQGIAVGGENYARAVAQANNKNPLPIIIPCHRVIGSNGKLVGYAGGLEIKERLLKIEKKKGAEGERERVLRHRSHKRERENTNKHLLM